MALDHPGAVTRLAVLDIVPTGEIWRRADDRFAVGYWHWPFLAQPAPLPERMILGDPEVFWVAIERMGIKPGDERYPDDVVAAYRAQISDPATVEAMCEDYRAGATIDRALDDADRGTRDDRLPHAGAVGRRGRAAALLRGPARAVAPVRAGDRGPRDRGRVALPRRGRPRRGRGRPRRVLRGGL